MSVELIADAIGVPVWALVPVALAAAAVRAVHPDFAARLCARHHQQIIKL